MFARLTSSVQLGATIDYAILLTGRYLEERKTRTRRAGSYREHPCMCPVTVYLSYYPYHRRYSTW